MGANGPEVYHCGPHEPLIDAAAIAVLREVALGLLESVQKRSLIRLAKEFLGQLNDTPGVLDDLHCLNPRKLVEEPATARIHEHRMPLEFQELERRDLLGLAQFPSGVPVQEPLDALGRA